MLIQQDRPEIKEEDQVKKTGEDEIQQEASACPAETAFRPLTRVERRNMWIKEYGEQDIALQMWAHLVEQQNLEITMMLQMHGLLVFGTLVRMSSYIQFYVGLNEDLHRENDPETADTLNSYYYSLLPPCDQPEIGPAGLPVIQPYIHMRDVTIMHANHKLQVPFWRGKISEVDAFVMGATPAE
ncbi:MAG TPA: hypothetical protein VGF67_18580 [Ktedonobacteraceae bacterium]|jgi:hypothetical protein